MLVGVESSSDAWIPGVTHKKEWNRFTRQIASGKCPKQLSTYVQQDWCQRRCAMSAMLYRNTCKDKTDVFALWLDANADWAKLNTQSLLQLFGRVSLMFLPVGLLFAEGGGPGQAQGGKGELGPLPVHSCAGKGLAAALHT